MRSILRLLAVLLVTSVFSPAEAQTEYFTEGERLISGSTFVQQGEDLRGVGFEVEIAPSSRVAFTFGYGGADAEMVAGSDGIREDGEIVTWSGAITGYPLRQGEGGAFTLGVGVGVGHTRSTVTLRFQEFVERFDNSAITLTANLLAAGVVTKAESPIRGVLQVQAGAAMLLGESDVAYAQLIGAGFGAGFAVSPRVLVVVEPAALVTISSGATTITLVGSLGLAYAF
ncbi:MAG: hypothetical protein ABJF88_02540 [Rhodothermales bacterium]